MSRRLALSPRSALGTTALLVLALTSTAVAGPAGADGAHPRPAQATPTSLTGPQRPAAPSRARVTLVTGDRVTVTTLPDGRTATAIQPAPGNTAPIQATTIGDHTFVFPQSALPYLAADLVDKNLFDVTGLIAQGYDDAHQRALPLIAQYAKGIAPTTPAGAQRQDLLPSIHGAALAAPRRQATSFWASVTAGTQAAPRLADGMTKLWLDGRVQADLAESTAQVGAPQAWADGYDGTGTTVAVLDTGIDADHPDLKDQIATSQSFVPGEDTSDHYGHGTHVASTIAGTGAASGGTEKGVAWGAHLAVGKVLGNDGFGQDSWIIAGMEWAADHAPVVNMSLGTQEISDGTDPISQAADDLSQAKGTLFVVSAGNQGCETCLGAPAAAQDALTVGSVDSTDTLSWFSSMGPRSGDAGLKPDLVAPGENILAARSSLSSEGEGSYISMSGTSMAAPHVAGAAAIVAQRHPTWTGAQIKDALVSAAHGLDGYTPYQVGTGRLDIPAALGDVHATGSVSFGFHPWPHNADTTVTHTVTYRNDGPAPVTLDLAADVRDGSGTPAPSGAITLSADQVDVPAGGSADVDVTGDPTAVSPGTRVSGALVASAGGTPVTRTSLGMDVEAERYNLTLNVTGRDGQPAQTYVMVHEQNDWDPMFVPVDGTATVRLPPGRYSVTSFLDVKDGDSQGVALVGDPEVVLSADTTVDLDAQEAHPVTVTSPRAGAVATWRQMEWHVSAGVGFSDMAVLPDVYDHMYAQSTDQVTEGSYSFVSRWRLRRDYISVRVGSHTVDSLTAIDSGWVTRAADTTLAYAGAGTPSEFDAAHVRGKIAVVALDTDTTDVSPYAAQAAGHGAKALLVVNHQPGKFLPAAGPTYGVTAALPVAAVSRDEGTWLVPQAQSNAAATLDGGANSPYVYDLLHETKGHIPTSLHYAPAKSDLARIDTRFLGAHQVLGGEFRWGFASYAQTAFGLMQYASFPSTRADYVSTERGTSWYQGAILLDAHGWDQRGERHSFRPGAHTREDWFGPVVNPRLGTGFWAPERQTDWFQINLPSYGDSWSGHTGSRDNGATPSQVIKLYRGDHLVQTSTGWQSLGSHDPLPTKRLKYRVTNDVRDPKTFWSTATSSHTSWTFWSHHADPTKPNAQLPFVSLAYHVNTDLHGRLPAGHRVTVHVSGYQVPHAVDAGRISGGWLKVSYNRGRTWTRVGLTGSAGHWTGHLTLPADASRVVSLRGSAWDTHGNSVTQSVIGAIELR